MNRLTSLIGVLNSVELTRISRRVAIILIAGMFAACCWTHVSPLRGQTTGKTDESNVDAPQVFEGHDEYVYTVSFSRDGRTMATAAGDNRAIIWDIEKRKPLHKLDHDAAVYAAAVSPDGLLVATASGEGEVALWNVATGKQVAIQKGHNDAVYGIAFSPDGKSLASAGGSTDGGDTACRIWKVDGLTLTKELTGHERQVYGVAFSPDGKTIATGSSDKTIRIWDIKTGESTKLKGHTSDVYRCEFSPDGTKLASVSQDGTVRLWTLKTASSETVFKSERKEPVYGAAFSTDGFWLGATGDDYHLRLWRTSDLRLAMDEKVSAKSLYAIAISPNQEFVYVAGEDGDVRQYPMPQR